MMTGPDRAAVHRPPSCCIGHWGNSNETSMHYPSVSIYGVPRTPPSPNFK